MGTSIGKPPISKSKPSMVREDSLNQCLPFWDILNSSTETCCISFRLQPYCIENRHFHAAVQKWNRAAYVNILDLTFHKSFQILVLDDNELNLLPNRLLQNTELQMCNVVGLFHDIIVIQVFCQEAIKFLICSLNDKDCKIVYNRKYKPQSKLQLYECYISPDENYMVIKQNQIYATMYNSLMEDVENISVVKLCWDINSYSEMQCDSLNENLVSTNHRFSVAFDPRTNNDLVVFSIPSSENERGVISLYKTCKDTFLFKIAIFVKDCSALPGMCQNLQFQKDGSSLILSVLGSEHHPLGIAALCRNQIVTVYLFDPDCYDKTGSFWYISKTSHQQYTPTISASGRFACCGGKIYILKDMNPLQAGVKSLKHTCKDLLVDLVLSEDINKLPLPKTLLKYLRRPD